MYKDRFKVRDRVEALRSHDKTVKLTGTIVKIHDKDDCVDVECEWDGKIVAVEGHVETVHAADCNAVLPAAKKVAAGSSRQKAE
jgi:hypothetical protein